MSRLAATFTALEKTGRKALIPFITAGDPNPDFTVPMMHAMVEAGVDVIELGVPFSDPMADGPVIQRASERALAHKMSLRKTLAVAAEFRKTNQTTPVVIMGYLNPIEAMGYEAFANAAQAADIDGVLTVDLPPEEAAECAALLKERGVEADAFESALSLLVKDSILGKAQVNIIRMPGKGNCISCKLEFEMNHRMATCPKCQCFPSEIFGGEEFRVVSLVVE